MIYHTALKNKKYNPNNIKPYTSDMIKDNIAFVYNIELGYNNYFDKCDIIYSEPAWKDGYMKFAKEQATNFNNYVNNICNFIKIFNKPSIIICGLLDSKEYQKFLKFKTNKIILNIHKCNAIALFYNLEPLELYTNIEILNKISDSYNCVGDFCCGYGNTADVFYKKNKNFVMSDIEKNCISYIKNKYENI